MHRSVLVAVLLLAGCATGGVPILGGADNRFCEPTYRAVVMPGQDVAVCEPEETVEFLLCLRFAGLTEHNAGARREPRTGFSWTAPQKPEATTPGREEERAGNDGGATRAVIDMCIDRFKSQAAIFEPLRAAHRKSLAEAAPPQTSVSSSVGP